MAKCLCDDRRDASANGDGTHESAGQGERIRGDMLGTACSRSGDDHITVKWPARTLLRVGEDVVVESSEGRKRARPWAVRGVHTLANLESTIGATDDKCHSGQNTTHPPVRESGSILRWTLSDGCW